jgi:hypothetical protein
MLSLSSTQTCPGFGPGHRFIASHTHGKMQSGGGPFGSIG